MRIGIDVSSALNRERTGVEEYTYQTAKHITLLPEARQHELVFYAPEGREYLWHERKLPMLVKKTAPDVFWSPANPLPLFLPRVKAVATIHGVEWKRCPSAYSLKERLYLSWRTAQTLKRADKIIAVSERSKAGLCDFFGRALPSVEVIYHGKTEQGLETKKLQGEEKHILFLGKKDKRKNIRRIVEAFYAFASAYKGRAVLTLAGPKGNDKFANSLANSTFKNARIENLPYFISSEEKSRLFMEADVLILASLDEGFGMPILEAQASGVLVVASSFLQEVGGEGALYCDPYQYMSIAKAMRDFLSDDVLYEAHKTQGLANCRKFSWTSTAEHTFRFLTTW